MNDGYYLSCYTEINPLAHAYRLAQRHDQNISLWRKTGPKVELVHYWELERVTGIKKHRIAFHDADQARRFIDRLLEQYGLSIGDMQEVWGTTSLQTVDDYHSIEELPQFAYHCVAHLFSALMLDTNVFRNEDIIALSVDAGSDDIVDPGAQGKFQFAGCVARRGQLHYFPVNSPAPLWAKAVERYQLKEGTLMALATATTSRAQIERPPAPDLTSPDFLALNDWFEQLEQLIFKSGEEGVDAQSSEHDPTFTAREYSLSMIMKEVQAASVEMMDEVVETALREHGLDSRQTYLAIVGGFALNCPTNSYLIAKYGFKGFLAPPCVNDGGQSLGIALHAFYKKLGTFDFQLTHPYHGDTSRDRDRILRGDDYQRFVSDSSPFDPEVAVQDIREHPVIWIETRSEIGPRALGARSILADPTTASSKTDLNSIKRRQSWMPVAPVTLEEEAGDWFEDGTPSPYMLRTLRLKEGKADAIPAAVHYDNTARVQTIGADSPLFLLREVLQAFKRETGVPLLCNTSLNDRSEPIINHFEEALNFALRKGIKTLYADGLRVRLANHDEYEETAPLTRALANESRSPVGDERRAQLNPFDLDRALIMYNLTLGRDGFDLSTEDGVKLLRQKLAENTHNDEKRVTYHEQ